MVKKVTIRINAGKISADFEGFIGRECERLEERIRVGDLSIEEKIAKPELYAETTTDSNTEFS